MVESTSSQLQAEKERRLTALVEDYQAVSRRLEVETDPLATKRLERRLRELETEIMRLEEELRTFVQRAAAGEGDAPATPSQSTIRTAGPATSVGPQPITILHLSDLQFGVNNRFPWLPAHASLTHDELLTTLKEDLDDLRKHHDLKPDLLLCTGDLAEWARPSEFRAAFEFLGKLAEHLGLSRDRVVAIPGNHDISRDDCEAYFRRCRAREEKPLRPYYAKWELWAEHFNGFYAGLENPPYFGPDQLWHVFELPELKVAVAALNSTMAERHDISEGEAHNPEEEGHFGLAGKDQCRWFADCLEEKVSQGWLRIGAIHHNVLRKAVADDENLRDAPDAQRLLKNRLNLVLHGHTHESGLAWWDSTVPVLATGSSGLKPSALPPENPNQYQILQIWPDRFKRWCRCFLVGPGQNRWGGDPRGSDSGSEWVQEHAVTFYSAHGTFPPSAQEPPAEPDEGTAPSLGCKSLELRRGTVVLPRWDYLDALQEVIEHRERDADRPPSIQRVHSRNGDLEFLRVSVVRSGKQECYPVAGSDREFDAAKFRAFCAVHDQFRAMNPQVDSYFVYSGDRAVEQYYQEATSHGFLRLKRFFEFQGLFDFEPYLRKQTARLRADPQYPPALYVPQRLRYDDNALPPEEDALARCSAWIQEQHQRFILVLGSFGHGKTFLMRRLALELPEIPGAPIPVLLEMRHLDKGVTLKQLVAQHFARYDIAVSPEDFRYMLERGRLCLLFDGFDELVHKVTYDRATAHLDTILEAVQSSAKVMVTSRTEHFVNEAAVKQTMFRQVEDVAGRRIVYLEGFNETQIGRYLQNYYRVKGYPEQEALTAAVERMQQIRDIRDLAGLSENPRLLSFIAEIPADKLEAARRADGNISAYDLYETLFQHWFEYEADKAHQAGAPPAMTDEDRWEVTEELAVLLWSRSEKSLNLSELQERLRERVTMLEARNLDADVAAYQTGSGTLLQRDEAGNFSFLHRSVQEFLIVRAALAELDKDGCCPLLERLEGVTELMAEFFAGGAERGKAEHWLRSVAAHRETATGTPQAPVAANAFANALVLAKRLGLDRSIEVSFANRHFLGQDFSRRNLAGRNFSLSVLRGVNFTGAILRNAQLRHADLTGAVLRDADLTGAALEGAVLKDADVTGATLSPAFYQTPASAGVRNTNPADGAALVWVPPGGFTMGTDNGGDDDEKPAHQVEITRGFWLYRTPVTNAQYARFLSTHPKGSRPIHWDDHRFNTPELPVTGVNWEEAVAYCRWVGGRLPTEAEWEYVARGPEGRTYPWGEEPLTPERAVYEMNKPEAVGSRPTGASWCGALDLVGNVGEWCLDWYERDYYTHGPARDPEGPAKGSVRVGRGGSWAHPAALLRAATRFYCEPDDRSMYIGFRVVWWSPRAS